MYCWYEILSLAFLHLDKPISSLMDEQQDSDVIQSCCTNHINNNRQSGSLGTAMAADITKQKQ
jgi:hypothetical protein